MTETPAMSFKKTTWPTVDQSDALSLESELGVATARLDSSWCWLVWWQCPREQLWRKVGVLSWNRQHFMSDQSALWLPWTDLPPSRNLASLKGKSSVPNNQNPPTESMWWKGLALKCFRAKRLQLDLPSQKKKYRKFSALSAFKGSVYCPVPIGHGPL